MIINEFGLKYHGYDTDVGCLAVMKYVKGILARMNDGTLNDVRVINTGKPLARLYERF
jgi:hypothetical protein